MIKSVITASGFAFIVFLVIDFIWLSNAARIFYRPQLGSLLAERPSMTPAIAFYVLYAIGLAVFVMRPAVAAESVTTALWMGALFGLVAYGTYDLTNAATLRGWTTAVTVVDMVWGASLTAVSAALGLWAARFVA